MPDALLGAVLRQARDRLRRAKIETSDLDARMLVASVAGLPSARLSLEGNRPVSENERNAIDRLIGRRLDGEPVGRILGVREFWSLPFKLTPDTLEPRPDTEILVEGALCWIDKRALRDKPLRIADLGTGSGAILISLLHECRLAHGVGTDVSFGALLAARENAECAGVGERADLLCMSYFDGLSSTFDLIVSNPPYICSGDIARLDIGVRDYDPILALDGGPTGLMPTGRLPPARLRGCVQGAC